MSAVNPECSPYLDELPELALGILTGRIRAETLAHVETCASCAEELERLSRAADALLEAVPSAEPPLGFEVRVLERLGLRHERRRPRARLTLAWSGALVATLGAFGIGFFLAPNHESGPTGIPRTVEAAQVINATKDVGVAVAYAGQPAWLTMSVEGVNVRGEVSCWGRTRAGKTIELGTFWLASGSGVWSMRLPTTPGNLAEAYLTSAKGTVLGEATFSS